MKTKRRRSYGDGSLWLRGNVWWLRWYENDATVGRIQRYESTGSTDRDYAKNELRKKLQAADAPRGRGGDPRAITYEEVRDHWLAELIRLKRRSLMTKDGKPTLSSIPRLDRFFAGRRIVTITVKDLEDFRNECLREITEKGANRAMAALRRMFRYAVKSEYRSRSLTMADLPSHWPMFPEPNEAVGAIYVEPLWYRKLLRRLSDPLRSALVLCYGTGIRVTEMERLRWRDLDLEGRVVNLPGESTKTGAQRSFPLPLDFRLKPGKADEVVFLLGTRYHEDWSEACVAIGAGHYTCRNCGAVCKGRRCPDHGELAVRHLKYHGPLLRHCRHTFARDMLEKGAPETEIMKVTGHVTRSMFDRYASVRRREDVEIMRGIMDRR